MSYREVLIWARYRAKYGSMGMVRKYDRPAALISSVLAAVNGNKDSKLEDFLPYGIEKEKAVVVPTFEELQRKLGRSLQIGRRGR